MDEEEAAPAVIGNRNIYVDKELFFRLLQDIGHTMSDKEKEKFVKNKARAAVKGKVHFEGLLYPNLYKLAEEVYKKMSKHAELFPRLPTPSNKTKAIHVIGKMIAKKRVPVARLDIHSQPQGKIDLELFNSNEYATMDRLFVLPQQDVIQFCNRNYGKAADSRKPTMDDTN
jgi:hypothetical protein